MQFSNKTYDVLKWISQMLLPSFATLYLGLSDIWGLPYKEEIIASVVSISLFLNLMLGLSSTSYFKDLSASNDLEKFVKGLDAKQLALLAQMFGENKKAVSELPGVNKK